MRLAIFFAIIGVSLTQLGCGSDESIAIYTYPGVKQTFVAHGGTVSLEFGGRLERSKPLRFKELVDSRRKISIIVVLGEVDAQDVRIGVVGYGRRFGRQERRNVIVLYRRTAENESLVSAVLEDLA